MRKYGKSNETIRIFVSSKSCRFQKILRHIQNSIRDDFAMFIALFGSPDPRKWPTFTVVTSEILSGNYNQNKSISRKLSNSNMENSIKRKKSLFDKRR